MFRKSAVCFLIWLVALPSQAQQFLTETEAINRALGNNKNIQAASLQIIQQQQLVKGVSGFNSTSLLVEKNPYELLQLAVEQQFDWPSVYGLRKKTQQEKVELANKQQLLTRLDITRLIKESYLQVQYLSALILQVKIQDSLYENIQVAAKRNFNAGQINKLEEQFASNQYLLVHNRFIRTLSEFNQWKAQLKILVGDIADFDVPPLTPYFLVSPGDSITNPTLNLFKQQIKVSEAELKTTRAENLPGFITGLIFPLQTPYQSVLGFRAGISIPLFAGQNRSRVSAAQTAVQLAKTQLEAEQQKTQWQLSNAWQNVQKEKMSLDLYRSALLTNADEIIATAFRLFGAGELTYIEALRNAAIGFEIKISYLETIKNYNQAIIEYNYLNGSL